MANEVYIKLTDLKAFMGIDSTDTNKDNELQPYVDGVNAEVHKILGRDILKADYIEKYKGTDTAELILNHYPINNVTAVEFIQDGQIYQTLDTNEFDIESEEGILTYDEGWTLNGYSSYMSGNIDYPRKHIRITYNAGYANVPSDIKLICLQYASDSYNLDNSQAGTLKSYGISDVKLEFRDSINFTEKQMGILRSYKGVRF